MRLRLVYENRKGQTSLCSVRCGDWKSSPSYVHVLFCLAVAGRDSPLGTVGLRFVRICKEVSR